MRRIAIVGSGISGLAAAHGLLQAGYSVDLYSDRTAQQWLTESRPTGTAARFAIALSYERELGLNFWTMPLRKGKGSFSPSVPRFTIPSFGSSADSASRSRPSMSVSSRIDG